MLCGSPRRCDAGLSSSKAGELYSRAEARLQVRIPPPDQRQTYVDGYLTAAAAAGFPTVEDPVSRTGLSDGMWVNAMPIDDGGRRQDACTAYIMPLMRAGGACANNLRLIQSATASKVVIKGGRAVGVQYIKTDAPEGHQDREIAAKKEVISSAGPYGSPRLLQLSGIGPASVLSGLGVDVILDLPVGEGSLVRPTHSAACAQEWHAVRLHAAVCMHFLHSRGGRSVASSPSLRC